MKLLIPSIDYPPIEGGISTVCLNLARECAALGHEVVVLAPWFPGMEAFDAQEPYRVVRFRGYAAGWFRLFPFLRAGLPLAKEADCVLAINVAYGGLLGRLAQARHGKPYACLAYAYEFLKFSRAPLARGLLRNVYRHAARNIAISEFTRDTLIAFGAPADTTFVALPGAGEPLPRDSDRIAHVRRKLSLGDAPFVLCVGRFIPRKNQLALVSVWPQVLRTHPGVHLVLVGRGPTRDDCLREASRLGLNDLVHCPGHLDDADVSALYHACTLFALANGEDRDGQVEGFGLVFAEAAAHGKAVIAGDSGGAREAVLHGETGLLVTPNDEAALAEALLLLLKDSAMRDAMGESGRTRVREKLNWRQFAAGVLEGW